MALEKTSTESGLRIYVDSIPTAETSNIHVFIGTGSVHESDKVAGISHALEHCVHVSTESFANEAALNRFDGLNSIVSNAETSYNRTVYSSSGPFVEPIVRRMGEILFKATYKPKAIKNEMSVIRREAYSRKDEFENLHDISAYYAAFGKPYGRDIIGYADKLNFSPDQLRNFYNKHYVLSNMAVVAVGNVTIEDIVESIDKNFYDDGRTLSKQKMSKPKCVEVDTTGILQDDSDNALVTVSTPMSSDFIEKYLAEKQKYESAMRAIDMVCNNTLRLEKGLSYDGGIEFRTDNHRNAWCIQGNVTVDPKNVTKARKVFKKVLQNGSKGITNEQIAAALGSRKSAILSLMDSLEGRSDMHLHRLDIGAEPEDLRSVSNSVRNLSITAIREAIDDIARYVSENNSLTHISGSAQAVKNAQLLINPEAIV